MLYMLYTSVRKGATELQVKWLTPRKEPLISWYQVLFLGSLTVISQNLLSLWKPERAETVVQLLVQVLQLRHCSIWWTEWKMAVAGVHKKNHYKERDS